jgi:hypothetical protein
MLSEYSVIWQKLLIVEFPNHIIRVTGDETWVSFVNVESKEQSKQWIHTHTHQTSQKTLNKVCLPES